MDDWRRFGMIAGIFWIGRLGIWMTTSRVRTNYRGADYTAYRYWPFVFIWADKGAGSETP